ncbi:hypothetical protein CYJ40_06435 [Brevibacterium ravenspurgense]|uniref:Uncharacterized protein n=1 Tax=Brevibacterium ravenspurgense TaxID=479117 RepID=A0A2I1IGU8_9MICO|nr:hypothetical protein [Brevibacterium ravenspurgense]PKY70360.1 hypothetical protein CYJ40_06435 [Brevibacterium ravenspurgense]
MKHADVSFAEDRTVLLTIDGASEQCRDLGAALAAVRDEAAIDDHPIFVQITDGDSSHSVVIAADGTVATSELPIIQPQNAVENREDRTVESAQESKAPDQGSGLENQADTSAPFTESAVPYASAAVSPEGDSAPRPARADGPVEEPGGTSEENGTRRAARRHRTRQGNGSLLTRLLSDEPKPTRTAREDRRKRRPSMLVPSIVLAVMLIVVIVLWVIPSFVGAPDGGLEETSANVSGGAEQPKLSLKKSDSIVPGFKNEAAWELPVDPAASVSASERGIVVVKNETVDIYDPATGNKRTNITMDGDIQIAADTKINNRPALLLRSGDTAEVLFDGEDKTHKYELPKNAEISLAGTSPMIVADEKLYHFHDDKVHPVVGIESGFTPMGLDGRKIITAAFDGDVAVSDTDTGLTDKFSLEKPGRDLVILKWVTAGHGKIVTVWGESGTELESDASVQVVVSDTSQGKIVSTVEAQANRISEAKWERGQGFHLAVFGPYLFDMKTGLLVRDEAGEDVRFGEPRGTYTPAVVEGSPAIVAGDAAYETSNNLMAVDSDGEYAVVRSESDTIRGYAQAHEG